jgi:hypothetical protein
MISASFLPTDNSGKAFWLDNFASKLSLHASKYGILPEEVSDTEAGSLYFKYVVTYARQIDEYKTNINAYRDELRDGSEHFDIAANLPALPVFAPPPKVVPNGIFKRSISLAQRIKKHTQYAEADGRDLGIIGEQTNQDFQKAKPHFTIRLIEGGHPEIVWTRKKMDGVEIWVNRDGSEDFSFLAYDQRPNYTDMHPLPAAGKAVVWRYKLIYRYKDKQAGSWSDVVSVNVSGN